MASGKNKKIFAIGDYAYHVYMGDGFIPNIVQVKIVEVCPDGEGFIALFSKQKSYIDRSTDKLVVGVQDHKELHTCEHDLVNTLKEAKEKARKLVNSEILSLKEQQSVLSRSINKFMLYKDSQPYYKKYEEENESTN